MTVLYQPKAYANSKYGIFFDAFYFSCVISKIWENQCFSLKSLYLTSFISLFSRSFSDFRKQQHFFFVFHFYVLWLNSSFAFVCCDFFFSRFRVFSLVYFIVCLQPASLLHARMRRYIESRKKSANLLYSDNLTFSFQSCITFVVVVAPIKCHVHHESTGNTHIFHRNNTLIIPYRTFLTRCMQYRQFRHFHVLLRHYGIVT